MLTFHQFLGRLAIRTNPHQSAIQWIIECPKYCTGGSIFDEGTANIVARSLLESYLLYYRLYNGCKGDKQMQELYFTLFDLSSRLHFVKFANTLHMVAPEKFDEASLRARMGKLISEVKSNKKYSKLPQGITNVI